MTSYHLDTAPVILQDAVIDAALTEAVRLLYGQPCNLRMAYVQALCAALEPCSAEDQLQGLAQVVERMKNS